MCVSVCVVLTVRNQAVGVLAPVKLVHNHQVDPCWLLMMLDAIYRHLDQSKHHLHSMVMLETFVQFQ